MTTKANKTVLAEYILTEDERTEVIGLYGSGDRVFQLDDPGEARELLQAVCAELLDLRSEIVQLRADLAREVRTERLAVIHPDDGRELISTKVLANSISLRVAWGSTGDAETGRGGEFHAG